MAEKSFPLNNTDYGAEDAQLFFATRTRGVFAGDHLGVTPGGGMNVLLGPGIGWLKNGDFGGLVYANTEPLSLTIGMADPIYPRVDRAVVRHDVQQNSVYSYVKQGVPASSPVPAELERSSIADEISVAQVYVEAGATAIGAGNITDERLNMAVCGLMRDGVTGIDTSVIEAQWQELTKKLRNLLDEETAGNLQNQIDEIPKISMKSIRKVPYSGSWVKHAGTSPEFDYYSYAISDPLIKKDSLVFMNFNEDNVLQNFLEYSIELETWDGYIRFTIPASKFPYSGTMLLKVWIVNGIPMEE